MLYRYLIVTIQHLTFISKPNQEVWLVLAGFLRSGCSGPQKTTKNLPNLWSSLLMFLPIGHILRHERHTVGAVAFQLIAQSQSAALYSAVGNVLRNSGGCISAENSVLVLMNRVTNGTESTRVG
ncbi:hypothetical protein BS47DRAFT_375815 [Hydnum rufescens UP504]|uniref:Uncharacterized protein n=1 Tax=Hydnum rufescens UP504 TaxID=1448309 RepID=A0A9P6B5J2_9AGAM|nr:hypothetical protein BS47DRAFT_375815 [Hydnum rufescens UP504]